MRILFLTCHLPWPPVSGGRLREWELLGRLEGVEVDLVAISKTPAEDRRNADRLADLCRSVTVVDAEQGQDPCAPSQVNRHHAPRARALLADLIVARSPDVVHVEGYYLLDLVPPSCAAPVLLVEQNVEYQLVEQQAALALDPTEARMLATEARLTREAEEAAWRRADACAALTEEDRAVIADALGHPVDLVPDGLVSIDPCPTIPVGDQPTAAFVANFAYAPNRDAAAFLLEALVEPVRTEVPDVRWVLVGNEPSADLRTLAIRHRVEVTGRVPSVAPYVRSAHVMVCPLRVGGGVKVKVLEALAHGKATVTTSIGAQGLGRARAGLVVEDDPMALAARVAHLLADPGARAAQEAKARKAASLLPSWDLAAQRLHEAYRGLRTPAASDRMEVSA